MPTDYTLFIHNVFIIYMNSVHTIIYFDEFMTTAVIVHFAFCVLYTDLAHFLTIYIDREEFKDEQMVDVKSLDIRNFL